MQGKHTYRNAGFAFLGYMAWYLLVMVMAGVAALFMPLGSTPAMYIYLGVVEVLLVVPSVVYYMLTRAPMRFVLGLPVNAAQLLLAGLMGAVMVPALLGVSMLGQAIYTALGGPAMEAALPSAQSLGEILLGVLCVGVTAAIAEEPLFRGIMLGGAASALGKWKALFLTSLVFALGHGNLPGLGSLFCAGLALGLIRWNTGSLWPAMMFHLVYNGVSVALEYVFDHIPALQDTGAEAITNAELFLAAGMWLAIGIPFAALAAALYYLLRKATPKGNAWGRDAWLTTGYRPWHNLIWAAGIVACLGLIGINVLGSFLLQ